MEDTTIDINNGTNQIAPNATVQQQIFLGDKFAEVLAKSKDTPVTMVVLGAGAEAAMGMPASSRLIPAIVEYLATPEGMAVDAALRKAIGGVRFHFDRFVNNAIDNLAKELDKELETICRNISGELDSNMSLSEEQRKLGILITRIFRKIIDIMCGAAIDCETENLIGEVLGTNVKDDSMKPEHK